MATKSFNKFGADASAAFKDFKMPRVDFEGAMEAHKKNMDAFSKAQRSAFDAVKTLTQAHHGYLKDAFGDMKAHLKEVAQAKTLEEKIDVQKRQMKGSLEKAVAHGRALTQTCHKAHKDTEAVWHKHFSEGAAKATEIAKRARDTMSKKH
jgi:phasin family protein